MVGKAISIFLRQSQPVLPQHIERIPVKGLVTDESNKPIAGATVIIVGSTYGVSTNAQGEFSIEVVARDSIAVSFVGKQTRKYLITNPVDLLVVVLKENVVAMDEVVVTGMFTRKAESFTGSAKTIKGEDLQRVGNGNVFQSLKNMDPSLNIMDNMEFGSDPNKLPTIQLRGTSSFPVESNTDLRSNYQDDPNQPLFILDGFEVSATRVFDMDMNRIQSLTILKDASAKAIYGSKVANGVVVIETRQPAAGEFRVTYKRSVDISMPDLYNKRMKAVLEGLNTDWLAKPLRTGVGTKHSLSFEMGDQKVNVIAAFSFNDVIGVMKGSDRKVLSGDIHVAYRLNDRFLFRNERREILCVRD